MLEHAVYQDLQALIEPLTTAVEGVGESLHHLSSNPSFAFEIVDGNAWDSVSLQSLLNDHGSNGFKVAGVLGTGHIILQKEQR